MMMSHALQPFASTMQKSERWIQQLMDILGSDDPFSTVRVLRAVLHTVRDRLVPDEAVHLAAQMPVLIRGVYFENWNPGRTPSRIRDRVQFLMRVSRELMPQVDPRPDIAVGAVFMLLDQHISRGELRDVHQMLPPEVRELWPEPAPLPHRSALMQEGMDVA